MTTIEAAKAELRRRESDVKPGGQEQMTQATTHRYVVTDDQILGGEPIIAGTRTPVRAIVEMWRQGLAPETIPNRLPHLTLAQVFDALSYFSDHQGEIQQWIERNRIPDELIDPLVRDF
jgi:uncharacterized protein (DUF433 family)